MARRQPPNPPLEHKCSYTEDGERCKWSFDRRYDCDRHERRHLKGAAREEILHRCPLGGACPHSFKTLQLGNLRSHIRNVHEDMQDLICQVCRPFTLATDSEALARHQAEHHSGQLPGQEHRTVDNTTCPPTPASSPPAVPLSITSERITLPPFATLDHDGPSPRPHCSFEIVHAQPPLPARCPNLRPIAFPCRPHGAQTPYPRTHSRRIPTLRDFLRDTCGIELTQCHGLPSPPTSGSS